MNELVTSDGEVIAVRGGDGRWHPVPPADPLEPEPPPAVVSRHALRNPWGWVFVYEVLADDLVTVLRSYRGAPVAAFTLPRPQARRHYRMALDNGFAPAGGDL